MRYFIQANPMDDMQAVSEDTFKAAVNETNACDAASPWRVGYYGLNADADDHFLLLERE